MTCRIVPGVADVYSRLFAVCLLLVGCDDGQGNTSRHSNDDPDAISGAIHEQLDEAAAVEDALINKKRQLDAAIDEATDR